MDLKYSFGGTQMQPLVKGVVPFTFDPLRHGCLQEALLERTEKLLHALRDEFDASLKLFDDTDADAVGRLRALNIMVATVTYTTNTILASSPSVQYAIMFERLQQILQRKADITELFGADTYSSVHAILMPVWATLRSIDTTFVAAEEEKD